MTFLRVFHLDLSPNRGAPGSSARQSLAQVLPQLRSEGHFQERSIGRARAAKRREDVSVKVGFRNAHHGFRIPFPLSAKVSTGTLNPHATLKGEVNPKNMFLTKGGGLGRRSREKDVLTCSTGKQPQPHTGLSVLSTKDNGERAENTQLLKRNAIERYCLIDVFLLMPLFEHEGRGRGRGCGRRDQMGVPKPMLSPPGLQKRKVLLKVDWRLPHCFVDKIMTDTCKT